ncbi:MAG: hypothetical protein CUN56_08250 [Phototrophicales bacterium]|nr:MAG: hypothetical protein CUN56_08250 [Phototrophicales bacterium]RMG73571.1 MAG: toll/interleukin-1 receptor domain-containing protein [Chloroflexota bacterium]
MQNQSRKDDTTQFASIEQKRIALRRALYEKPHDPNLLKARDELISKEALQAAAQKGIFISYSRCDELFAFELAIRLNDYGIQTWLDSIHVREQQDWYEEVTRALNRAGLMLAVFSPEALEDRDVTNEWARFMASGKLLIPIIHRACDLKGLNSWIAPIDFTRRLDIGIQQLRLMLEVDAEV